jgi:aspartate carbamoyltransferase catalytic subunit
MQFSFSERDVLSTKEIPRSALEGLFDATDGLRRMIETRGEVDVCKGKVLSTVFLEPSTRTRLSFQFAMVKVGGQVIDFGPAEAASIAKGETFEDTMRMVDGYGPDAIVVRNKTPGSAAVAAEICSSPVINAGDGSNEHPTQAMLDLYTIRRIRGKIDGLKIGLMGDLAHSRTTSSLSYALDKYDEVDICYIAPKELQVRDEVLSCVKHAKHRMAVNLEDVIDSLDFLYVTRLQRERFSDPTEYERLKGSYLLDRNALSKHNIPYLMHPLPRVDELNQDLDSLPQAKYFEQAKNGIYVRAALLALVLGKWRS